MWFADVVVAAAVVNENIASKPGGHCLELTTLYSLSFVVIVVAALSLSF